MSDAFVGLLLIILIFVIAAKRTSNVNSIKTNGFVLRYGWTHISPIGTSHSVRSSSAAASDYKFTFIKNG
jgi:hypothetical protein